MSYVILSSGFRGFSGSMGHSGGGWTSNHSGSSYFSGIGYGAIGHSGPSGASGSQGISSTAGFNNGQVATGTVTIGNVSYSFTLNDVISRREWSGEVMGHIRVE